MWPHVMSCDLMWSDARECNGIGCYVIVMRCGCAMWLVVRSCDNPCGSSLRMVVRSCGVMRCGCVLSWIGGWCAVATLGWDADFGEPMSQYYDSVLQSITQYSALQGSIPYYKGPYNAKYYKVLLRTTTYYTKYYWIRTTQYNYLYKVVLRTACYKVILCTIVQSRTLYFTTKIFFAGIKSGYEVVLCTMLLQNNTPLQ